MADRAHEDVKKNLENVKTFIAETEAKLKEGQPQEKDLKKLAEILATFAREQECW